MSTHQNSNILLVDVDTIVGEPELMDAVVTQKPWSHLYLVLRPRRGKYYSPSISISPTMIANKQVPVIENVYVPPKTSVYSFISGFISGRITEENQVHLFTNTANEAHLKPLINRTSSGRVHFIHGGPAVRPRKGGKHEARDNYDDDDEDNESTTEPEEEPEEEKDDDNEDDDDDDDDGEEDQEDRDGAVEESGGELMVRSLMESLQTRQGQQLLSGVLSGIMNQKE